MSAGPAKTASLAIIDAEGLLADTVENLGGGRLDEALVCLERAETHLKDAREALEAARKEKIS